MAVANCRSGFIRTGRTHVGEHIHDDDADYYNDQRSHRRALALCLDYILAVVSSLVLVYSKTSE
jgi:hypothetical protein